MSVFDLLVYDRTQADVDRVAELKAKYPDWTAAEKNEWLAGMKGSYNASDLNRIGEAIVLLYQKIYDLGYRPRSYVAPKTDWTMLDTPTQAQMTAILEDIRIFRDIALLNMALPETFNNMTFEGANQIERVLYEINEANIPHSESVVIFGIPVQALALYYTGGVQTPTWDNYNPEELTIAGSTSGTDANTYTVTFTPNEGYIWSDDTVDPKIVTWTIDRSAIVNVPSQSGTLVYSGSMLSPSWNNYDANKLVLTGDTSKRDAGTYTAVFTPSSNYCWSGGSTSGKSVSWTIKKATITATPSPADTLTYTGSVQSPTWNDYDSSKLIIGGVYSSTNAGTYTATFTPRANYQWSNGSTEARSVSWTINKATLPTPTLSSSSVTLTDETPTKQITVTRSGNGAISASSSASSSVTVEVSGNTLTLSLGSAARSGTFTISVTIGASDNYLAYDGTLTCTVTVEVSPIAYVIAPNLSAATYEAIGTRAGSYALIQHRNSTLVDAFGSSLEKLVAPAGNDVRGDGAAVTTTQRGMLGGGSTATTSSGTSVVSTVKIYNASLSQSNTELSSGRFYLGAAGVGNYSLFGGGQTESSRSGYRYVTDEVDAFDASGTQVSWLALSRSKCDVAGANGKNHAIFAGGVYYNGTQQTSRDDVDAFDTNLTKISNVSSLYTSGKVSGKGFFSKYAVFMNGKVANIYDDYLTKIQKTLSGDGWYGNIVGMNKVLLGNDYLSKTVNVMDESLTEVIPSSLHNAARRYMGTAYNGTYAIFAGGGTGSTLVDAFYER